MKSYEADALILGLISIAPEEERKGILTALHNALWRQLDQRGYFPHLTGRAGKEPHLRAMGREE